MSGGDGAPALRACVRRVLVPAVVAAAAGLLAWEALDRPPAPASPAPPEDAASLARRIDRGIAGVRARFRALESAALGSAEDLAGPVLAAVPGPGDAAADRAALFEVLSRRLDEDHPSLSGVAVVDREGRPLAWWGRILGGSVQGPPDGEPTTRVLRSRVYQVIRAEVPLTGPGGDLVGAVRTFAPFFASLPLHNRYLRRLDFEAEAEEALGLERVDLEFDPPEEGGPAPLPPLSGRVPLEGLLGQPHGTLEVTVRPPEVEEAVALQGRSRLRRGLLAAVLVLALLLDAAPVRRLPRGWPRAAGRALLVLGVRAALLALGAPGPAIGGEVFDPYSFSVTWLGGALRTPGDALLSAAALLAASVLLARSLPAPPGGMSPPRRAGALLAGAAVAAGGWAAMTGLARAVAFQSRLDLFPGDRVLPTPAAAALFLSVGAVAVAALVPSLRLLSLAAARRLYPGAALGRGLALASAAALLAQGSVQWEALQALRTDALAAADRLEPAREREERVALENLVERLAGPSSVPARVLRGRGPRAEDAAFYAWAGTPELNGRPDGCALEILDDAGAVVSRFDIDIPPPSWLPEPPAAPPAGAVVEKRPGRKGAAERSFFAAAAPVSAGDGAPRGSLRLWIPAVSGGAPSRRPEILRNYGGARPPPVEREVHRAVFEGDRLLECTNPDYPRGLRAPPEAVEAVLQRGEPVVWVYEQVGGTRYHNAYLARREGGRPVGLLSVGFPSLTLRQVLLNLAKVFFLMLAAAGAFGLAAGAAALVRGRARPPALGFRAKVLAGFVLVGAVPVVGLAFLERSLAEERTREAILGDVRESLRVVEDSLRDAGVLDEIVALAAPGAPPVPAEEAQARVRDDRVKEIAYRAGVPVSLFLGDRLLASSERGIFATELFSTRLAAPAYQQVVLLGRGAFTAQERFGSFPFLVGYAPVRGPDGHVAGVISVPLLVRQDRADRDLARTTTVALALYILVLLGVAGAGAVLARRMARPVESLAEGTRRVAAGDLAFRIPGGGRDELGALVESFNRMTEGLEAGREAAARAEREAAWREMAKQVAHEIKNPLTPLRLHAQHLLRAQRDGSPDLPRITEKAAETVLRQTEALQRIASDFSSFARLPRRNPEDLDLAPMVREAADLYRGSEGVEISVDAPGGLPAVRADREEIRLVLVNLCGNAVEAMPRGGRLTLRLRADAGPPPSVVLEVGDSGVGIPPEDVPRLFDPSFSTKTRGTGLGLAIVHRAVEAAGGRVAVRSEVGRGSVFTVALPALPDRGPPAQQPPGVPGRR